MDLRERALAAHRETELEHDHERHKDENGRAERLADEARRYVIETLGLEPDEIDTVRALVVPGATTATVHVGDLEAFRYRSLYGLRPLYTCPECGAREAGARTVADLATLGAILAEHPSRLRLVEHEHAQDKTYRCDGSRSWSTVQEPPRFLVELISEQPYDTAGAPARVAASLGRMAAATANPAQIYPGPHGWLIVARVDPDPPAYDGEEPF